MTVNHLQLNIFTASQATGWKWAPHRNWISVPLSILSIRLCYISKN